MKVNYIGIACLAVLLLTACDESKYELENLVPEEYHKVLYINKSGTQELTLYNTGELNTYAFSVYKGGSDPSLTASGEIAVHSQEEVDVLYGADYRIILQVLIRWTPIDWILRRRNVVKSLRFRCRQIDRCGDGGESGSDLCASALPDEREGLGQCR